jgi:hypothetical protein
MVCGVVGGLLVAIGSDRDSPAAQLQQQPMTLERDRPRRNLAARSLAPSPQKVAEPVVQTDTEVKIAVSTETAILREKGDLYTSLKESGRSSEAWTAEAATAFSKWTSKEGALRQNVRAIQGPECFNNGCFLYVEILGDVDSVLAAIDRFSDWPQFIRLGVEQGRDDSAKVGMVLFNPARSAF